MSSGINLIPEDIKYARMRQAKTVSLALLAVSIVAGVGIYYFSFVQLINYKETKLADANAKITALRPVEEKLNYLTELQTGLSAKTKMIDQLTPKFQWTDVLTELESLTPGGISISSLAISDGGSVQIQGTTKDFREVAKYLISLSETEFFGEPELRFVGPTFNITCTFKSGKPAPTPAPEEVSPDDDEISAGGE